MGVEQTNRQYDEFSDDWSKTRHVLSGDRAVKANAYSKNYVRPYDNMFINGALNTKQYNLFLNQSVLSEFSQDILTKANGLLYAKLPTVEVPKQMEEWLNDVTLAGQSLNDLSKSGTREVLSMGRVGYLLDMAELKEDETTNNTPYLREYKTENIINWRYAKVNGVITLVQVVLQEEEDNWSDDGFTNDTQTIYRVLRLTDGVYTQQVYKENKNDKEEIEYLAETPITPTNAEKTLNKIPFYGISPIGSGLDIQKSPLTPVINLNVLHFSTSVVKGKVIFDTGAVTIVMTDGELPKDAKFTVGGFVPINSISQHEAKIEMLERTGDAIPAYERELTALENQCYKLGIGIIQDDKLGVESIGTQNSRTATDRATVGSVGTTFSEVMTTILKDVALWMGLDTKDITFALNDDFIDVPMNSQDLKSFEEAMVLNPLSMTTKEQFDYKVKGGLIAEDVDYESRKTELEEQRPTLSVMPDSTKKEDVGVMDGLKSFLSGK